jgi:hypothetical protein
MTEIYRTGNYVDEAVDEIVGPALSEGLDNKNKIGNNHGYEAYQQNSNIEADLDNQNEQEVVTNNLIKVVNDSDLGTLKPLSKQNTITNTVTRTTTRYVSAPTNVNNNNNSNNSNDNYNHHHQNNNNQNNSNSQVSSNNNNNNNNSQHRNQDSYYSSHEGNTQSGSRHIENTIPIVSDGQFNENASEINPTLPSIDTKANEYGHASTNNNIESQIIGDKIENANTTNSVSETSNDGVNFTFIVILVTIPILIIVIIASIYFVKKYKKGKRGSNIVYPDDKIRKSNLFGTLQFWNSNKMNRESISSGSRGSRTNLTSISNDKEESNVPEYSEWLEAGSNTLSMPRPVTPPPVVTDGKVNGLSSANYAMGVNINNDLTSRNSDYNGQITRPPASKNAWKLEGMRIGQRKSTRQSLFNSFKVW